MFLCGRSVPEPKTQKTPKMLTSLKFPQSKKPPEKCPRAKTRREKRVKQSSEKLPMDLIKATNSGKHEFILNESRPEKIHGSLL